MGKDPHQRSPKEYFCSEILRLPPAMTEPDFYSLLGLKFFETDHGTIVRAAMERIRLLESCQADTRPGYQKALRDLLGQVRQAQITLLDVKRRKAYDETLTGGDAGDEEEEEVEDEIELRPGTMVAGRYRVLGERRRGALGLVYNAMDSTLRTRVELSVLRPRLSEGRRSRRRAARAAQAAASLDHPGILRVDEAGDADGLLFVRMRQAEGKNLLEAIEATPRMRLDADTARDILRQIAEALAFAHERELTHGDLRPHNVFISEEGRVLVADFRMSRTVLDELGDPAPRTRAPENEDSPAADLFALGCLAYQMLAGMPPFAADTTHYVPRPLPEDVPEDLEVLVTRLLARDPDQRPQDAAEVVERLAPARSGRRLPAMLGAAAVLVVALAGVLISQGGEDTSTRQTSVREQAWKLIAEKKFDEAIRRLREAREKDRNDQSLIAPLAGALDRKAALQERRDDPWGAQICLEEAQKLVPQPERIEAFERVRQKAEAILERIPVRLAPCTATPTVRIELGDRFQGKVEIGGQSVAPRDGVAERALTLGDGAHDVGFALIDRAGNRRAGLVSTIVDTVPPKIRMVSPEDGAQFSRGEIRIQVEVEDANPPEVVTLRGRRVKLVDGVAADLFKLEDGEHVLEALVVDRAGLETRASARVVVDSNAPELVLAMTRIATAKDVATVRGMIATRGATIRIDGKDVPVADDGSFEAVVPARQDRRVPVVATGPTGLTRKLSVGIVVDREPPVLQAEWDRRDRAGALLYGTREMDGGGVRIRVRAKDKTTLSFEPIDGRMEGEFWVVDAHEGARRVRLTVSDEAGNATKLELAVEGHRATPALIVKNTSRDHTNETEATLEIEADGTVLVQGKETEPGRIKVPMPEGRFEILVQARDRFGNENRWTRTLRVDRTAPTITLHGYPDRGVGRQELRFDSNEDLATLTCFGKTIEVGGRTARLTTELKPGRRRVTVVARDLAGNVTKTTFTVRVVNRVLVLDGASALRVAIPEKLGKLTEFTVECWVRGSEAKGRSVLFARSARSTGFGIFWSREDRGLPYAALVIRDDGFTTLPARKGWKWERWTHVALCFDGQRARFFVNGSPHSTVVTKKPFVTGQSPLLIGAGPDSRNRPAYMFRGALDEFRLSKVSRYARAFSPARYHKEDEHTILLLRFDTRAGEQIADTSGNGLHASLINVPRLVEENR